MLSLPSLRTMNKQILNEIFDKNYEKHNLKKLIIEELLKAINEEHWITIGADKETDRKGTHILVKDGETNKEATERKIAEWKTQKKNKQGLEQGEANNYKKQVEELRNILRDYDDKYEKIRKQTSEHRSNIYQMYEDSITREEADRKKEQYIKEHEKELDKLAKEEDEINENRYKKQKELDTILNKEVEKILDTEIGSLDKDTLEKLMQNGKELFRMPILYPMQEKLRTKIFEIQDKLGGAKYRERNNKVTTIDGVSKGKPMTFEEADNKRVNPNYGKNTADLSYNLNCQSCVVCYQMRRNGFNVQTKGIPMKNGKLVRSGKMYELASHPEKAWIDPETGDYPKLNICDATTPEKAYKWLDENVKEGTYSFRVIWKNEDSGHIVIAHRVDGVLTVYDPQKNADYFTETSIISEFFDNCRLKTRKKENKPFLYRTDTLDINPYYADAIMEKA